MKPLVLPEAHRTPLIKTKPIRNFKSLPTPSAVKTRPVRIMGLVRPPQLSMMAVVWLRELLLPDLCCPLLFWRRLILQIPTQLSMISKGRVAWPLWLPVAPNHHSAIARCTSHQRWAMNRELLRTFNPSIMSKTWESQLPIECPYYLN